MPNFEVIFAHDELNVNLNANDINTNPVSEICYFSIQIQGQIYHWNCFNFFSININYQNRLITKKNWK